MNKIEPQQSRQPFLRLKNVSKSFGHVQALDKVNLDIYEDEIVGLVGDNGAGKSTLVKILSGVYFADECEIEVDDKLVDIKIHFITPAIFNCFCNKINLRLSYRRSG